MDLIYGLRYHGLTCSVHDRKEGIKWQRYESPLPFSSPKSIVGFENPLEFVLEDGATVVDVSRRADEEIRKRVEKFPVKGYQSLFYMVYHPLEERFYKQVAIQGYT